MVSLLNFCGSSKYVMVSHCGFNFTSLVTMLSILSCAYLPPVDLCWGICLNLLHIFCIFSFYEFFIYSGYFLIRYVVGKYFFLVWGLSFHSSNSVFKEKKFWICRIPAYHFLWIVLLVLELRKLCLKQIFSFYRTFVALDFTFRFIVHFESISAYGERYGSQFIVSANRY